MVTLKDRNEECENWKSILRQSYMSWRDLVKYLAIENKLIENECFYSPTFPLRVTRQYASRIEKGNPNDPLFRQIVPLAAEQNLDSLYTDDPVGEFGRSQNQSLLITKYKGRALMIATGSCAIHCRYCFRKNFPYTEKSGYQKTIEALQELKTNVDINELIISGGDPLTLDDSKIQNILETVYNYDHIRRIRFHSRVPIVFPPRITPRFLEITRQYASKLVLVTHINHPQEIDAEVSRAINLLRNQKIILLNQSVLLSGVNDNLNTLLALSNKLFTVGILPYYMHMLDKVTGSAHYNVSRSTAKSLQKELYELLPAYLVPRFVEEIPNRASKIPI